MFDFDTFKHKYFGSPIVASKPMSAKECLMAAQRAVHVPVRKLTVKIVSDYSYLPWDLKYPTGKKDGNKLGKRKKNEKKYRIVLDQHTNTVYVHPTQYEFVVDSIKNSRGLPIVCDQIDSSTFWEPALAFHRTPQISMKPEVSEDWFKREYLGNWELPILKSNPTIVGVQV